MYRAAFSAPFTTAEVHTITKATSPQTSPAVPMLCEDGRPYFTDPVTGRRLCACHLSPEGAHSHLHGGGALSGGIKSLMAPPGAVMPSGLDGAAFYNPLLRGFPVRPERLAQCLTPSGPPMTFDPAMAAHPYGLLYAGLDVNGLSMRKAATRETTGPLKAWLHEHRKNPYPTKAEKIMLAIITKMTLTQVSTWFANARRRLKKESRLYTGRENDNEDQDDDVHAKDDDDEDNDTEETPKRLREHCESDEDINVDGDVSDISDNDDSTSTSAIATITTISGSSPGIKQSPLSSSSSSLSPYPPTPPFHSHFTPRPGPMPGFPVGGLPGIATAHGVPKVPDPVGSTVSRDCSVSCGAKTLTTSSCASQSSRTSSSSNGSSSSPAVVASRPKIWSISEIIHSDASAPATAASSAAVTSSANGSEGAQLLIKSEKWPSHISPRDDLPVTAQRPDFLQHRLTSPFRTLDLPEVRLASRHASAFFVPGAHPSWVAPSVGLRLANPCHVMNVANGRECRGESSPDAGCSPLSEDSARDRSPQTEALDLQTKKEEKDDSTACT